MVGNVPAARRLLPCDQVDFRQGVGSRPLTLGLQESLFGVVHIQEVQGALPVRLRRGIQHQPALPHHLERLPALALGPGVAGERVIDVAPVAEFGGLEGQPASRRSGRRRASCEGNPTRPDRSGQHVVALQLSHHLE